MTKAQKEKLVLSVLRAFPDKVFSSAQAIIGEKMQWSDIVGVKLVSGRPGINGIVMVLFNDESKAIRSLRDALAMQIDASDFSYWCSNRKCNDHNDILRYAAVPAFVNDGVPCRSFSEYVCKLFMMLSNIEVSSLEEAELQFVLLGKMIAC